MKRLLYNPLVDLIPTEKGALSDFAKNTAQLLVAGEAWAYPEANSYPQFPASAKELAKSRVLRFDHIGITVADLALVTDFFTQLGLEIEGQVSGLAGEFLDTVCGLEDARTNIVMLKLPETQLRIELSNFEKPAPGPVPPAAMANELGLRSLAFEVEDLAELVAKLDAQGYGLVGGIDEYQREWRMAYVRGPEGIIVALAQRLSD